MKLISKIIPLVLGLTYWTRSALAQGNALPCPVGQPCIPNLFIDSSLNGLIGRIVTFITLVAGSILVVVILVGAFQIMTSSGNPENIKKGRNAIVWALIGFAIILVAGGLGSIVADILDVSLDGTDVASSTISTQGGVINIIDKIAKWMFNILMALSVVFVLYSAFLFLISGGDSEKVGAAKRTLIYAIVALVIAVLAGGAKFLISNVLDGSIPGGGGGAGPPNVL